MATRINDLPPELFLLIFKNLNFCDIVENCSKVCVKWQGIVSQFIFGPYIVKLSEYDAELKTKFLNLGWKENCCKPDIVMSLYDKIKAYKARVLVVTGVRSDEVDEKDEEEPNGHFQKTEIIDLIDEKFNEKISVNFPGRFDSVGCLIQNHPIVCGGTDDRNHNGKDCHVIGQPKIKLDMLELRAEAAIVKLSETALWIIGGTDDEYQWLDSTEFINFNCQDKVWLAGIEGPKLPFQVSNHRAIKYDEESIYIISGVQDYDDELYSEEEIDENSRRTWISDPTNNFEFTLGPPLNVPRADFSCGIMESNDKKLIVVAGGRSHWDTLDSVEILDPSLDQWTFGPNLPFRLKASSMITSPDGKGVILIGGQTGFTKEEIFKDNESRLNLKEISTDVMIELRSDTMEWNILEKTLNFPRNRHIAIEIPYDLKI